MTKKVTRLDVKKHLVWFVLFLMVSIGVVIISSEVIRIIFSALIVLLLFFVFHACRLLSLPEDRFIKETEKMEQSKGKISSTPCKSNETTDFNLYYSPNAFYSPHNDD